MHGRSHCTIALAVAMAKRALTRLLQRSATASLRREVFCLSTFGEREEARASGRVRFLSALAIAILATASIAEAQARSKFDLPSQPLADSLRAVGSQANVNVLFDPPLVAEHDAPALKGEYTTGQAFTLLLMGTGITHEFMNDHTVVLAEATATSGSASPETGERKAPQSGKSERSEKVSFSSSGDSSPGGDGFWKRFRLAQANPPSSGDERRTEGERSLSSSEERARGEVRLTLEEVVVTAQKREERTIDVPMSITAISGDKLTAAGISNAQQLSFAVPSMVISEIGPGRQMIAIRGIHGQRGSSSLTGVYLDELPLSGAQDGLISSYADVRIIDLERVEVLKGPQGTLFGEGAAGGVIRFITKDPDLNSLGGKMSTEFYDTVDGGWSEEVTGIVNVPLAEDVFGIRVAAKYENVSGWIDEPSIGRQDINDQEVKHVRVKALYMPTPEFQIKGMAEIHRNDGGGSNIVNQEPHDESNFLQAFDQFAPTNYTDDYDLYNLTATYDFGFASLLSSTSYAKLDGVQSFTQLLGQAPVPWLEVLDREYIHDQSITSQELRLTSATDTSFKWTLGAAYKDIKLIRGYGIGEDLVLFGGAPFEVRAGGLFAGTKETTKSESWAEFASASYQMGRFEIGGGLRYFHDARESFSVSPAGPNLGALTGDFNKLTFRTFVKFQASEDVNLYVSAGNGFRSGGFNAPVLVPLGAPASYGPEESIFYEAGTKMSLLDGRVRVDVAAFYGEFQDMQEASGLISPVNGLLVQFIDNSQDAELKGVEWDIGWLATDRLTLTLAGDRIDSEITRIDPANLAPSYGVGDPINTVPKYSLSVTADYRFQWFDAAPGSFLLSFNSKGKSYFSRRDLPGVILAAQTVAPVKDFLNASIGGEWNGWEVSVFGRNILDERDILNPTESGWTAQARPRTFGIGISKEF